LGEEILWKTADECGNTFEEDILKGQILYIPLKYLNSKNKSENETPVELFKYSIQSKDSDITHHSASHEISHREYVDKLRRILRITYQQKLRPIPSYSILYIYNKTKVKNDVLWLIWEESGCSEQLFR